MPYDSIEDLPNSVRAHLPPHASEIYRRAFNNAWTSYEMRGQAREEIVPSDRLGRRKAIIEKRAVSGSSGERRRSGYPLSAVMRHPKAATSNG
jgi:hypothetical protein